MCVTGQHDQQRHKELHKSETPTRELQSISHSQCQRQCDALQLDPNDIHFLALGVRHPGNVNVVPTMLRSYFEHPL